MQLLSCSRSCTCRNIDSMSAVRAIGPSRNLNIVPVKHIADQVLQVAFYLGRLPCTLNFDAPLQTRLTSPSLFELSTEWWGEYKGSQKFLLLRTGPIFVRISLLRLYLLTLDTNSSSLGPFEIFAPVSKADPKLSCSCWVGLALVH